MALIIGKERPRVVQSDEIGQAARMLRQRHEKEVEENARKAAERQKRLDAEAAKKKADFEAAQAKKDDGNGNTERDGLVETPKTDEGTEPKADEGEELPQGSKSIIDGSQIKLPKKKVARKPKTKK